jgi:sigma-B regulation protein RsbU (phosphoserine phosphatase)
MVLLGAVFVSMLIAFFLSRGITKPILRLVQDMSIVSGGDLEHETKSSSSDEIGYLSATFNQLTRSLKTAHEAEIEKEKLEHDMSVGREIQQTLLPKSLYKIPGYDLDAFYLSAKEVGGDYFDLIPIDKSKLGVIVADVSGKGIQGAMIMTIMRTVMNIAAVGNLSCKNCLGRTNRFLSDRIKRGMFVTAFYVILDCRKHKLLFSSAGHNPMLIYRAATKTIEQYNPTGIALGFDKGPLFERTLKEAEEVLKPGDRFVLYTDGVVESMNEAHEEFTDARFEEFVIANSEEDSKTFIHKLVAELKKHQGKAPQHDDITIVTFRRKIEA